MNNNLEIDTFLQRVHRILRRQRYIDLLFGLSIVLLAISLSFGFTFLVQSALMAGALALFALLIFSYLLLRQYLTASTLASLEALVEGCKQETPTHVGPLPTATLCTQLSERLYNKEYSYLPPPRLLQFLRPHFLYPWNENLSAWMHWKEILFVREKLLQKAVASYVELVRCHPTHPEAHALLANSYVLLSGLFISPRTDEEEDRWVAKERFGATSKEKFLQAAQKAIQEFKILQNYAPKDPWVYMQLAYSYRDLRMNHEEKAAYQAILALRPNDHDTRFRLGILCFEQGETAEGLQIYQQLKEALYPRAEALLTYYGS